MCLLHLTRPCHKGAIFNKRFVVSSPDKWLQHCNTTTDVFWKHTQIWLYLKKDKPKALSQIHSFVGIILGQDKEMM